jgi:hypothetical protein
MFCQWRQLPIKSGSLVELEQMADVILGNLVALLLREPGLQSKAKAIRLLGNAKPQTFGYFHRRKAEGRS